MSSGHLAGRVTFYMRAPINSPCSIDPKIPRSECNDVFQERKRTTARTKLLGNRSGRCLSLLRAGYSVSSIRGMRGIRLNAVVSRLLSLSLSPFPFSSVEQSFRAEIRSFPLSWLTANDYLIDSIAVIRLSFEIFEPWTLSLVVHGRLLPALRDLCTTAESLKRFVAWILPYLWSYMFVLRERLFDIIFIIAWSNTIILIISSFLDIRLRKQSET